MIITVFAKKRMNKEGKPFYSYIARLPRKDGTEQTVQVKFRDSCGNPKPDDCPCCISVERKEMNLVTDDFVREDTGEVCKSYKLWVSNYVPGPMYVDHSLDEFDV